MLPLVDVLKRTERFFRDRGLPLPRHDAEQLLAHVTGLDRLQLYLQHDRPLTEPELASLRALVKRRAAREPLGWILGEVGFHRIDLAVGPGVLVPRPDTETLVDAALGWIDEAAADPEAPVFVADVGSGSGAVGLALAHARPAVRVYAIDRAEAALDCTRTNVARLGLQDRVAVLRGSLLDPVPAQRPVDWVVSNPPYVRTGDLDQLQPEVARWEPREALDGGRDGLDVYQALIPRAWARARCGVLLEIGEGQHEAVGAWLRKAGAEEVATWKDTGGIVRVVGARHPTARP